MTDILQNHYSQVKNPNPVFTPREGKKTLPFCRKLMAKAEGFTSRFDFSIHVAFLRYDPLANRVQRSITNMAIECGLATESRNGNLSVSRATRALKFLAELGLITYQTEYDPQIGCNIPTDITFTPALFSALDVSEVAVVAARRSRVEWENLQRKKQKHGRKRDTARRDASRQRHDIETRVRQQLTREYATGRFRGDKEALKREVERRVQERMLLSRGNNYTRLATVPI
ncbi:MAG: plasmid replication initiator RepA [Pseudomonas aeruginosa]|nr:plasmid replication initiator RepA [Pseudomonas aeruginosa]